MGARPWAAGADGLSLSVRLTPKGGRDSIDGVEVLSDGRAVLKARVRAAPTDGEANDALVRFLAKILDVAPRDVQIVAGATARIKRLIVQGNGAALASTLDKVVTEIEGRQ